MSADRVVSAAFTAITPKPSCTLVPDGSRVFVRAPAHGKPRARRQHPAYGVLKLSSRCDQTAGVTLAGKLTAVVERRSAKGRKRGRQHTQTKTFAIAPVRATATAGKPLTLIVKLPAAARAALSGGARASMLFTLTATNANGTSSITAGIPRLQLVQKS